MTEPMTLEQMEAQIVCAEKNTIPCRVCNCDVLREACRLVRSVCKENERLESLAVDFEAEAKVYRIQNGKLRKVVEVASEKWGPHICACEDCVKALKVHKIDYGKPAHPGIVLKPDTAS